MRFWERNLPTEQKTDGGLHMLGRLSAAGYKGEVAREGHTGYVVGINNEGMLNRWRRYGLVVGRRGRLKA